MDAQNSDATAVSPHRDTALLLFSAVALLGGMFAFYYFEGQFNAFVRTLMLLAGTGAALFAGYQTRAGKVLWGYVTGSRVEWRKIVWPSRQESLQATLMIAVVVLIMALLLWGLDSALLWSVEKLTGRSA